MNITTEVKDRVIVFMGGGTQFITKLQEAIIASEMVNNAGGIKIDGNYIALSSIARIISRDQWFAEHPDKVPAVDYPRFDHKTMSEIRNAKVHKQALESMIRGMKGYIGSDRYQGTEAPKKLLENMELRLMQMELSS